MNIRLFALPTNVGKPGLQRSVLVSAGARQVSKNLRFELFPEDRRPGLGGPLPDWGYNYDNDNYRRDIIYYEPSPPSLPPPPPPLAKPGHFEADVFFAAINDSATDKTITISINTPCTMTLHNKIKERLIKEVGLKSIAKPDSYYWRELGTVLVPGVE